MTFVDGLGAMNSDAMLSAILVFVDHARAERLNEIYLKIKTLIHAIDMFRAYK